MFVHLQKFWLYVLFFITAGGQAPKCVSDKRTASGESSDAARNRPAQTRAETRRDGTNAAGKYSSAQAASFVCASPMLVCVNCRACVTW